MPIEEITQSETKEDAEGSTRIGGDLEHAKADLVWLTRRFKTGNYLATLKMLLPIIRKEVENKSVRSLHEIQLQEPQDGD